MRSLRAAAFILLFIGFVNTTVARAQDERPLGSLKAVSGGLEYLQEKFSIADRIFSSILRNRGGRFAVYDLDGKYSRLEGWIGVDDKRRRERDKRYAISVDGQVVLSGEISSGDKPIRVDLDVSGARSVRVALDFEVLFADAVLSRGTSSSSQPSGVTNLIAPRDGARVTGNSVNLHWEPVDGAVSYGVEIVCTKLNGSSSRSLPRMWAINVQDGETSCRFDLSSVPNGDYHWSVIAFNSSGVMGKFSKNRVFSVMR